MIENFNIEASSSSHNKHQHVNQSFSHDSNIQKTMLKAKNKTLTQRVDYLKHVLMQKKSQFTRLRTLRNQYRDEIHH